MIMKRWTYAAITIAITVTAVVGFWTWGAKQTRKLIIFHAGSLTKVVEDMGAVLSREYGIRVVNEPRGSVDAVRMVTDLGRPCDVLMVADYRLVRDMMFDGGYTDWVLVFASNEMVLAYTDKSLYADKISSENWLEILLRDDVRVGFSNPNRDPCGYRAIMVLALASIHYGTEKPLRMLEEHASITYTDNGTCLLVDATKLQPDSVKVFVRDKSVDLVSLLEIGSLDYAFEYRNVAQAKGLKFVELPDEVNLANPDMDDLYSRVAVKIVGAGGSTKTLSGSSIAYGVTVPNCAVHQDDAIRFVELLLSDEGRQILVEDGFRPLENPFVVGAPPQWLEELIGG